jgi:hypothetical protein
MRGPRRALIPLKDQSEIGTELPAVPRLQQALAREIEFYQVLRLLFTGQDCHAAEWQETNRTRMQPRERAKGSRARSCFYPLMPKQKLPNPMKHRITVPQQTPQKQ